MKRSRVLYRLTCILLCRLETCTSPSTRGNGSTILMQQGWKVLLGMFTCCYPTNSNNYSLAANESFASPV